MAVDGEAVDDGWRLTNRDRVRAAGRLAAAVAVTVFLYSSYLVSRMVLWPFPAAARRVHDWVLTAWGRTVSRIFGMRLTVEGRPPEPPFFLVSNHVSYFDIVAYFACVRGTFLAKAEIASWPLMGLLARGVGTLFVDRERKRDLVRVTRLLEDELRRGRGIIVFPEGTSTSGDGVLPFKASTLEAPAELGMPVHCAAISYETPPDREPARTAIAWWGKMRLIPHVKKLAAIPAFEARIRFDPQPVAAPDRKQLAERALAKVVALRREP